MTLSRQCEAEAGVEGARDDVIGLAKVWRTVESAATKANLIEAIDRLADYEEALADAERRIRVIAAEHAGDDDA